MWLILSNLLVTSEDRDDGRAAYHGQIPDREYQWRTVRQLRGVYLQEGRAMANQGTVSEANV